MDIFKTHAQIVEDYATYIRSFLRISDGAIRAKVEEELGKGKLWPQPLLQFNPSFERSGHVDELISTGILHLHPDICDIFKGYQLYRHQVEAIQLGITGKDFVVTSGTGSGKSLTYIGSIFHHLLTNPAAEGVTAVVVYPMNALINSQFVEFERYKSNYEKNTGRPFPISFGQYTGQEKEDARQKMREKPPQILLTNYMMLELLLTRVRERSIRDGIFRNLRFLVFDELHTYRGRQGADVALLIRRIRSRCVSEAVCIGTSATMVSVGSIASQRAQVAEVATKLFGRPFTPDQVVSETLTRSLEFAGSLPTQSELASSIAQGVDVSQAADKLKTHPVAVWLENRVALELREGVFVRQKPQRFDAISAALAEEAGLPVPVCREFLQKLLQWISAANKQIQDAGEPYTLLPFKLHQFFSQTGSVYTTLDQDENRFITLDPGVFKEDERDKKPIFPNVFSRASGHPFICVTRIGNRLEPREFRDNADEDEDSSDGYLIVGEGVWDESEDAELLPETWFRVTKTSVVPRTEKKPYFPVKLHFDEFGNCSESSPKKWWGWFMKAPLLFDPTSGTFYDTKTSEGTKLTKLGSEGRSTSTTITSFSILTQLADAGFMSEDQKLLSFTDNRQDAALQAGHFNDFLQVVLLRAAIRKAVDEAPGQALTYKNLGEAVFKALNLPFCDFANRNEEPGLPHVRRAYEQCFQEYLVYRAVADLRRSWRIVLPNLEQCALLAVDYAIRECIYGVDLNPLAVELCKVALWLEAHSPGEPLNFLDHHIKCGNAIVGFTRREELDRGVPDEAFVTVPGDDKDVAATFRRKNKAEREHFARGQRSIDLVPELKAQLDAILGRWREISRLPEHDPAEIEAKKKRYEEFTACKDAWLLQQIACIPIAQFYLPKTPDNRTALITDEEFRVYLGGQRTPTGRATAAAWAMAIRKRFFHWFLEFPDIIAHGGFDCILGNPPYLGNRALSGTYGDSFLNWVKWEYSPAGAVDLVTYFLRRIYDLLAPGGALAIISTNTIAQGAAREGGLDVIAQREGGIHFAVRSTRWPGRAAVSVCLLGVHKGSWGKTRILDGKSVDFISTYLEPDAPPMPPLPLADNVDKSFQGSIILGKGFLLPPENAVAMIRRNPKLQDVVFPYLNGDDVNSRPDQSASRFVINFFDWSREECSTKYPEVYAIVERLVRPERTRLDEQGEFVLRKPLPQRWWMYADKRPKLYATIADFERVLVAPRVSKYVSFVFVSCRQVFMDKLVVIADQRACVFAILQSTIHGDWAWRYSSTLGASTINYAPSDCFVSFPFPFAIGQNARLAAIGERYHERRRTLMLRHSLGLTDIYNLFHYRDLTPALVAKTSGKSAEAVAGCEGILQLRELHRELDEAVLAAYGWTGQVALGHDFHEVETLPENDRVRYTISPTARKEILRLLLALNLQRRAQETAAVAAAPAAKKATRKPKSKPVATPDELKLGLDVFGRVEPAVAAVRPKRQLPAGKRHMAISEAHYLFSFIPTLLDEAGKVIDWDDFVRAMIFLGRPDVIQPSLTGELAQEVEAWRQRDIQPFSLRSVIPAVRELGAKNLRLEVRDGRHLLHLQSHRPDPLLDDFAYDADLAVRVMRATAMPIQLDTEMRGIREAAPELIAVLA